METEIQSINRLMRQGFSDEKLFKMFPKHIDYIKDYREFLIEQSKPYVHTDKAEENFIEEVFQIAFGDNALNRGFSFQDVLNRLKKNDDDLYHYQNNTIVAYDRNQLDDAIGKESYDGMWELCQELIHNNDGAWSAMSDACAEAEDDIQHLIDEEEMNNK